MVGFVLEIMTAAVENSLVTAGRFFVVLAGYSNIFVTSHAQATVDILKEQSDPGPAATEAAESVQPPQ